MSNKKLYNSRKLATVEELIKELQKCDQDAVVLFGYCSNTRTGVFEDIDRGLVVVADDDGIIENDKGKAMEYYVNAEGDIPYGICIKFTEELDMIEHEKLKFRKAIKIFCE